MGVQLVIAAAGFIALVVGLERALAVGGAKLLAKRERERTLLLQRKAEAQRLAAEAAHRAWTYRLQSLALTCGRCGKVAVPVPATADRYGCPACNHRFLGPKHDVPMPPSSFRA